jgi:glycosyltransferase involved in cell wall biosynthesis
MVNKKGETLPLVSILLPVFNEESFIEETLEGIIKQDYRNVEILISDNHSIDNTASLCKKYAQRDKRILFFEQATNLGAIANHEFLLTKARGKYFIFSSGHDKWSSRYIVTAVESLEKYPSAVISYGTPSWIDENGESSFNRFSGWYDTRGLPTVSRFFFALWGKPNPILGLIRRENFPDMAGYNFVGADNVILCLLALQGEFIHVVSATFFRRQNRAIESHEVRLKRYVSDAVKMKTSFVTSVFPLIRMPIELIKIVFTAPISKLDKLLVLFLLLPTLPVKYFTEKNASK